LRNPVIHYLPFKKIAMLSSCPKKYFTPTSQIGFRLVNLEFDLADFPASSYLYSPLPFIPLAWLTGNGTGRALPLANLATQKAYYPALLQLLDFYMIECNIVAPNLVGPPGSQVGYIDGQFSRYMNQYIGDVIGATPQQLDNYNSATMPLGVIDSFWQLQAAFDELAYNRFLQLIEWLGKNTDLRLWTPPGKYQIDGDFGPVGKQMSDAFNDPNLGGGQGLSFLALQLKSIE
jgi:hypothetical protein